MCCSGHLCTCLLVSTWTNTFLRVKGPRVKWLSHRISMCSALVAATGSWVVRKQFSTVPFSHHSCAFLRLLSLVWLFKNMHVWKISSIYTIIEPLSTYHLYSTVTSIWHIYFIYSSSTLFSSWTVLKQLLICHFSPIYIPQFTSLKNMDIFLYN